jgi:L-seryl-tRNA(Ser) seleniumtransferase
MNENPYVELGVRPFINCCSVRTLHGGSLRLPQVRAAMEAASRHFVNLDELMEGAGRRIAALTGAEWGLVTCGSAAALALAGAAAIAGNDPVKMLRLPSSEGTVNRVIIPADQRFAYDQAFRLAGGRMVEVKDLRELEEALAEPAALVTLYGKAEEHSAIPLEEVVKRATPRGVPILVDAASEHLERPVPWLLRGADLAVYSGGKFLRGPQTSGLLLGNKPLVEAAWRNASPHQAFGRPMKVSKEDVIGVLAALEYWFGARDREAEERRWYDDLETIAAALTRAPRASSEMIAPEGVERVPRLFVSWDREEYPLTALELRDRLLEGEPRIMLDDNNATKNAVEIDPFQLAAGEAAAVGERIAAALIESRGKPRASLPPAAVELGGEWELAIDFLRGNRRHRLRIEQRGGELSGNHRSHGFAGPLEGAVEGERVAFRFEGRFEGSLLSYRFTGKAAGGEMAGRVVLGAANGPHRGIVNLGQFGGGAWQAKRLA